MDIYNKSIEYLKSKYPNGNIPLDKGLDHQLSLLCHQHNHSCCSHIIKEELKNTLEQIYVENGITIINEST